MIKKRIIILIFLAPLLGCLLEKNNEDNKEVSNQIDILWKISELNVSSNFNSIIDGNLLFFAGNSISCIDLNIGKTIWTNQDKIKVDSHLEVNDKFVFTLEAPDLDKQEVGNITVLNKKTGERVGIIVPSILCFDYGDKAVQFSEWWVEEYKNNLYIPIRSRDINIDSGIYKIDLNELTMDALNKSYVQPELILKITEKQRISSRPVFDKNRAYFYVGGSGPLYVEGGYHLYENCYTQDVVRMLCTDLKGNIFWDRGFEYIGCVVGGNNNFKLVDNTLYIADSSGIAAIKNKTGEVIFEKKIEYDSGSLGVEYLEYSNKKIVYSFNNYLKCSNSRNGKVIWEFDTKYTNSTNPIIYGNIVYNVDPDALRGFNIKNGKKVYENTSLGISGYRTVGYIPHKDDVIYIMKTNEIIAVKIKDKI